jgi:AraC-like DNA-binding protein/mannose-6-phosphate isomerase-like protein (cupin superfamily)
MRGCDESTMSRNETTRSSGSPKFLLECLNQSRHVWDYWRCAMPHVVEMGTVRGLDVGLPTHFHAEDQITLVLAGRRRFYIGCELIEVSAGHAVRIPAGTPHRSLGEETEVVCVNIYATAAGDGSQEDIASLAKACGCSEAVSALKWRAHEENDTSLDVLPVARDDMELLRRGPVAQVASRIGMTREGFSRKIKKIYGISPQEIGLMARLNIARRLLQEGHHTAAAAAASGFSDQSHLGRCFVRAFGVTPGRYRAG